MANTVAELPFAFRLSMTVLTVIFTLLILFTNASAILLFRKTTDLQEFTKYFFISLAVTDLGMGLIVPLYTYTVLTGTWPYGHMVCQLTAWWRCVFVATFIWQLFFLTVDTFVKIYKPLVYLWLSTRNLCLALIAISWTLSFIIFMLPLLGFGRYNFLEFNGTCLLDSYTNPAFTLLGVSYIFLPILAIYVINCFIWCVATRKRDIGQHCSGNLHHKRNWRAAKTVLTILVFFTLTSVVMYIMHLVRSIAQLHIPAEVEVVGGYMGLANHWVHIFIYSYFNKKLRHSCIRLYCCCCAKCGQIEATELNANGGQCSGRRFASCSGVANPAGPTLPIETQSTRM